MKKAIVSILIMILVFGVGMVSSYADEEYSCDVELNPSKETVKPGEEFIVKVRAKNINAGEGIVGAKASFIEEENTDFELLELVKEQDWGDLTRTASMIVAARDGTLPSSEDQDMFSLKLKVKDGTEDGEYTIKLSDVNICTDDLENIDLGEVTKTIEVKASGEDESKDDEKKDDESKDDEKRDDENKDDEKKDDENKDDENKDDENKDDENKQDKKQNDNSKKEETIKRETEPTKQVDSSTISGKEIPKTGVGGLIGVGVVATIAIAVISYKKYNKYKSVK